MRFPLLYLSIFLFCCSCSTQNLDHFREKADAINRSLICELQAIHTKQDLLAARPTLKAYFNDLADIMITAQEWHSKNHDVESTTPAKQERSPSDQLRFELNRVYTTIEEGRQLIEQCQEDALFRLDAHSKKNHALKGSLHKD